MNTYKVIFDSGVTELIEAGSIERNDVLEKVVVKTIKGEEIEECYLNLDHISAIIPQ